MSLVEELVTQQKASMRDYSKVKPKGNPKPKDAPKPPLILTTGEGGWPVVKRDDGQSSGITPTGWERELMGMVEALENQVTALEKQAAELAEENARMKAWIVRQKARAAKNKESPDAIS